MKCYITYLAVMPLNHFLLILNLHLHQVSLFMNGEFTYKGFLSDEDYSPTIQLAFAYSFLPSGAKQMKRRLRIQTVQLPVATTRNEVYNGADPDSILTLLVCLQNVHCLYCEVHKVIRTALDEGISESRLVLEDWLTILLINYNKYLASYDTKVSNRIIDTSFAKHSNLKNLCRF